MSNPFFSVIVATFNRAGPLPRAIDSLLAQDEPDWELIVADDGSTDSTPEIMARYGADPRVSYLRGSHGGPTRARNAGIRTARGRWITFLDSDDEYRPDHLSVRRRFIESHPEARFIHGGVEIIGPPETHYVPDAEDPTRLIPITECFVGGTFVIEAGLLRDLGGYPEIPYGHDFALARAAAWLTVPVVCDVPTYRYHREPGQGLCEATRLAMSPSD